MFEQGRLSDVTDVGHTARPECLPLEQLWPFPLSLRRLATRAWVQRCHQIRIREREDGLDPFMAASGPKGRWLSPVHLAQVFVKSFNGLRKAVLWKSSASLVQELQLL